MTPIRRREMILAPLVVGAIWFPTIAQAAETSYRVLPHTIQQSVLQAGALRVDPPVQFVGSFLTPAPARRNARFEHFLPPPGRSAKPLSLVVRRASAVDVDFDREPPFEHSVKRMLVYWGCGEQAGPNQPLVIPVDPAESERLTHVLTVSPGRQAESLPVADAPTRERWIARQDTAWPEDAQMQGAHELRVGGASVKFIVEDSGSFLSPVPIAGVWAPADGRLRIQWRGVPQASAYFANLFIERKLSREVVIWTSSRNAEAGWILSQSHPGARNLQRLLDSGVLLAAHSDQCTIPSEVTRHAANAMLVQLHAFAPEVIARAQPGNGAPPMLVHIAPRATSNLLLIEPFEQPDTLAIR